jgi:predicted nucleic acid-binding Zn ribbon protein
MLKTCKTCGKQFEPGSNRAVHCSTNCRVKAAHARDKERKRAKVREADERAGAPMYHCCICGKEFRPRTCGCGRRYLCSDGCRSVWRTRNHLFSKGGEVELHCKVCGKPYTLRDLDDVFCSAECKAAEAERYRARAKAQKGEKQVERYTPDDAARARADLINEFRRQTRARAF